MALKLTGGTDALLDALGRTSASELFDPARPSGV
jgi:hypothetical protein